MTDIQKRLERLEKSNRRMRLCGIAVVAVAAAVATVGATSGAPEDRGGCQVNCTGNFYVGANDHIWLNTNSSMQLDALQLGHRIVLGGGAMWLETSSEYGMVLNSTRGPINFWSGEGEIIFNVGNWDQGGGGVPDYSFNIFDLAEQVSQLQDTVDECCNGAACDGDSNSDDVVDVSDLLIVVGNWGPCE
jgi:hypothetical protein